jgi:SAM-dependent methyltransferase
VVSGGLGRAILRGSLQVTATQISGWVFDPEAETRSLEVRLRLGGRVIGEGVADLPRPDVATKFGIAGDHGFRFPLALAPRDAPLVVTEARAAPDRPWQRIGRAPARRPAQYQSFDDACGASRSGDKLEALRLSLLPNRGGGESRPLAGLSVLDLGCNEGFFCGEALRQGARRVLGIDANNAVLARARARFPEAEVRHGSWWDIPDEKFDVILCLSAIHYEPDQAALLRKLAGHLTPTGTLVVECGISSRPGKAWQTVTRVDGKRRYPTLALFVEELSRPFATRLVGASVPQRGDPVPRRVFHCALRESMVLLVIGPSRIGKSTLAREFGRHEIPVLRTDQLLGALLRDRRFDGSPVAATVRRFLPQQPVSFTRVGNAVAAERPGEFVDVLLGELPSGPEMICIEGEILRHRSISDALVRGLRARNVRPWIITARRPSAILALASRAAAGLRAVLVTAAVAAARASRATRRSFGRTDSPAVSDEAPGP